MRAHIWVVAVIFVITLLCGCDKGVHSPRGFSLPEGDPEKGKTVFFRHNCMACHSISGLEAEVATTQLEIAQRVPLGGKSIKVTTYAELVTNVVNPSHKISRGHESYTTTADGKSVMTNFNDVMSVSELIDLVAFLQTKYEVVPYTPTSYPPYTIH